MRLPEGVMPRWYWYLSTSRRAGQGVGAGLAPPKRARASIDKAGRFAQKSGGNLLPPLYAPPLPWTILTSLLSKCSAIPSFVRASSDRRYSLRRGAAAKVDSCRYGRLRSRRDGDGANDAVRGCNTRTGRGDPLQTIRNRPRCRSGVTNRAAAERAHLRIARRHHE